MRTTLSSLVLIITFLLFYVSCNSPQQAQSGLTADDYTNLQEASIKTGVVKMIDVSTPKDNFKVWNSLRYCLKGT
ncbi:MAG TPA: hypothetical protein ENH02_04895 [Bacteroidetes bacterium]|nr:hypothetical protein [Bacteroidota bacterium]